MIRTIFLIALLVLTGCMSAAQHGSELHSTNDRKFTVGLVQTKIYKGMPQSDVVTELGSPNLNIRDESGLETWVYDKVATEASYSNDSGSTGGLAGAGGVIGSVLLLGGVGGDYSKQAGASARTQRTLTVVIKFDDRRKVNTFSYHSSKF